MNLAYQILTRVQPDRELWEIQEESYGSIEEARGAVEILLITREYRAIDIKIMKDCGFTIRVTNQGVDQMLNDKEEALKKEIAKLKKIFAILPKHKEEELKSELSAYFGFDFMDLLKMGEELSEDIAPFVHG